MCIPVISKLNAAKSKHDCLEKSAGPCGKIWIRPSCRFGKHTKRWDLVWNIHFLQTTDRLLPDCPSVHIARCRHRTVHGRTFRRHSRLVIRQILFRLGFIAYDVQGKCEEVDVSLLDHLAIVCCIFFCSAVGKFQDRNILSYMFPVRIRCNSQYFRCLCRITKTGSTDEGTHGAKAILASFLVLFAAEWGDLSQLLTLSLVARYDDPLSVFIGAWGALLAVSGLAVIAGRVLLRYIPLHVLHSSAPESASCWPGHSFESSPDVR